ncbi:MAG: N-acetylmuramoyl-L-alanine amidase [Clostridia bacterium]|nr:N-acetylmuramoyl-L-alanine amidase [Clostridia bacterium]
MIMIIFVVMAVNIFPTYCIKPDLPDNAAPKTKNETVGLNINGEVVHSDTPPVVVNNRTLVPARAVFEKLGANVSWDKPNDKVLVSLNNIKIDLKINHKNAIINNKTVEMDVPPKIINGRTLLPVRFVSEHLNMKVNWLHDENMIAINTSNLGNITYTKNSDKEVVTINLEYYKNYNIFTLSNPHRVVIDFPNIKAPVEPKTIRVNKGLVKSIRYALFEKSTARIVLDMSSKPYYTMEEKEGQLVLNFSSSPVISRGGNPVRSLEPKPSPISTPTPTNIVSQEPTPTLSPTPSPVSTPTDTPVPSGFKIHYSKQGAEDAVVITMNQYKGYKVVRVTDPDRLVIDIPNPAPVKDQNIDIDSTLIKSIRCSQYERDTTRVVLDVNGYPDYEVDEQPGQLVLQIKNPSYKNILYHNNGDRVSLILSKGAYLTENGKNLYKSSVSPDGLKYTVTFPSHLASLGSGIIKINDKLLESIQIIPDEKSGNTSIVFHAKEAYVYEIFTRREDFKTYTDPIDTAITLLKPAQPGDYLVVIDPGHGGFETGAIGNGLIEKTFNLDIALRLNELLKKRSINTYMIREDDSYVDLYERANIANKLNASLFMSIHNNSFTSGARGTETFYYSAADKSKFNGEAFSDIVQRNLIESLGTYDRGSKPANYVVIKETNMPSVLTEVAFLSNAGDAQKLRSEEFRQKAAEALCEAIVESLKRIQK